MRARDRRDPTLRIVLFLLATAAGLALFYTVRVRHQGVVHADAVPMAQRFSVVPEGPTLAVAVARDAGVGVEAVRWEALGVAGEAIMTRVAARVARGEMLHEYRFDVDHESGAVHPANPRARELFATLRARRP